MMALFMRAIIVSAGLVAVFIALAVCYEIFVRSVLGRPVGGKDFGGLTLTIGSAGETRTVSVTRETGYVR